LSYLYGKYERFLCDTVSKEGTKKHKIQYILYKLSNQKNFNDDAKNRDKMESIKEWFPGIDFEDKLPEFELSYLPLATVIKTTDIDFVQNLFNNRLLSLEEKAITAPCGGFCKEYLGCNIIIEFEHEINVNQKSGTEIHELFHAEMNLQNSISKKTLKEIHPVSILDSQISDWKNAKKTHENLETFFKKIKICINEEVMAFFSQP
jgi:hypothetical protein